MNSVNSLPSTVTPSLRGTTATSLNEQGACVFRLEFKNVVDRKIFVEKFYYCHSSSSSSSSTLAWRCLAVGRLCWFSNENLISNTACSENRRKKKTLNAIYPAHAGKNQAGNKILKRLWFLSCPPACLPPASIAVGDCAESFFSYLVVACSSLTPRCTFLTHVWPFRGSRFSDRQKKRYEPPVWQEGDYYHDYDIVYIF